MKRWLVLFALVTLACLGPSVILTPGDNSAMPPATPTLPATPASVATVTPRPTFTPTPEPSPTPTLASDPRLLSSEIHLFPWPLYAGDRISVDADPYLPDGSEGKEMDEAAVTLSLGGGEVYTADVAPMGLDAVPQARFYWITELPDVAQTTPLTLTLDLPEGTQDADPGDNRALLSVGLRPRDELPPPEPSAHWAITETTGFKLHYLTGSAAERDLDAILAEADRAYEDISGRLGTTDELVDIYLLDRVIGQGGYASPDWVAVSYVDRKYSPTDLGTVLRHELTHRLDAEIGCQGAPAFLREGLAVYMAGGHYRPESLRSRAAALVSTSLYVPLPDAVEGFYTHQHEIAYLEAGSLVEFVAERLGRDALVNACEAASATEGGDPARWESAVEALGYENTAGLERAWKTWLQEVDVTTRDQTLLDLEFRLMDAMRAYQAAYDPPAHFLEGILFSPAEGERLGIVADFVRRPRDPESVGLELVLAMAQDAVERGDVTQLGILVDDIESALAQGPEHSQFVRDAVAITRSALAQGWEPYRLVLETDQRYVVYVLDRQAWPQQSALLAQLDGGTWILSTAQSAQ